MLQTLHNKIQGWFAGTIMGLIAIAFALWGIQNYLGRGGNSNAIAKVNGKIITEQQLNSIYERMRQSLQGHSNSALALNQAAQAQLKQKALQQLITTQVLSDAALKQGYLISPAQMDDVIMQLSPFQVNGQFSPERFQQVLNALGYSQDQFVADLGRTLLVNQMQTGILASSLALPNESQKALALIDQKRDISFAIIPAEKFLNNVEISSNDINHYYQQHQDDFKTPEKVSIEYIELLADQLGQNIHFDSRELQQNYQDNISSYTKNGKPLSFAQAKGEIEKSLKQQKLQQLFSDQNQKLSDLTYTNSNTLEPAAKALGLKIQSTDFFTRDGSKSGTTANSQVIAAAFSEDVLKNGNNSNLISIKDGTVIVLRMKNYQPMAVRPLAEVKKQIEQQLRKQAAQNAAYGFGEEILTELQEGTICKMLLKNII